MIKLKRLMKFVLSAAAAFVISFVAIGYTTEKNTVSAAQTSLSDDFQVMANDPSYLKFIRKMQNSRTVKTSSPTAIYGSGNLVHNSKFNGCKKSYVIDVSQWQGNIDWKKVKASGITGVVVRLGYRGYGNGALVVDPCFYTYINGAISAGLDVGAYFYTQAISTAEAAQEANFCINALKGYKLDMPVYMDMEDTGSQARFERANLSYNAKTNIALTFCKTIEANSSYKGGFYANRNWLWNLVNGYEIGKNYSLWLAEYANRALYDGPYEMWQYTGNGYINGVQNVVDINVKYEDTSVKNVRAVSTSSTSIKLAWDKYDGASGYRVYTIDKNGVWNFRGETTNCTLNVTGLNIGTGYKFVVRQFINEDKSTKYVKGKSIVGQTSVPLYCGTRSEKGQGLKCTALSENSVKLSWSKAKLNCDGYQIAYYNPSAKQYKNIKYVDGTSAVLTGYTAGKVLTFVVRPYYKYNNKNFYGLYSDYVVTSTIPPKVTGLICRASGDDSVKVQWDKQNGQFVYNVMLYENGKYVTKSQGQKGNYFIIKNINPASENYIKVQSVVKYNGKNYATSEVNGKFTENIFKITNNVGVRSSTKTSVRLSWDSCTKVNGYRIYMISKKGEHIFKGQTTDCSFDVKNLTPGTGYTFIVRPFFNSNNSLKYIVGQSELGRMSEKVYYGTRSEKVTNLKYKIASDKSVILNWSPTKCKSDGYQVSYYDSDTKEYTNVLYTTRTSATIDGLNNDEVKIIAVRPYYKYNDKTYYGYYSDTISVSTKPSEVTGVAFNGVSANSVKVLWNKSKENVVYDVLLYRNGKYVTKYKSLEKNYCVLKNLKSANKYTVKIRSVAKYNAQRYKYSEVKVSFTNEVFRMVSKVRVVSSERTSVKLDWNSCKGATGYRVYTVDTKGNLTYRGGTTNSCSLTVKNLKKNTKYKFIVKPYFNKGKSVKYVVGKSNVGRASVALYCKTR